MNEIYSVDILENSGVLIYGGINDTAIIYNYEDYHLVAKIQDFSDSVIYSKFISDEFCLVVSMNGTLLLNNFKNGTAILESINEDVSAVNFDGKLVVGTEFGNVFIFDDKLNHINTIGGHKDSIMAVEYKNNKIYSISKYNLYIHDETGKCITMLKAHDAVAYCHVGGDVLCLGRESSIQIYKGTHRLWDMPSELAVETVEMAGKNVVVGGLFKYLMLIDTTARYATYKLEIGVEILKIKARDDCRVVFITTCGQIGMLDIRDVNTLMLFDSGVGMVFDLVLKKDKIVIAGELGATLLDYDGNAIFRTETIADEEEKGEIQNNKE